MNGGGSPGQLVASEVHGFRTWQELDVKNLLEEAGSRWLRPNEIHAILCNCNNEYFPVNVKPVHLPKSNYHELLSYEVHQFV
ncbi:hypothetical protein SLEP1_g40074 [Rubroshorea leprosula]|uniref:CG-1 domain-containing protein n=1 Tax=Rubroshorea leprosula TaxID=152421 RepID=A0AAV5L2P5_9ROSI|nr:hypothetical protein SLEP1_g40074 [Rubroshorea leprosula]